MSFKILTVILIPKSLGFIKSLIKFTLSVLLVVFFLMPSVVNAAEPPSAETFPTLEGQSEDEMSFIPWQSIGFTCLKISNDFLGFIQAEQALEKKFYGKPVKYIREGVRFFISLPGLVFGGKKESFDKDSYLEAGKYLKEGVEGLVKEQTPNLAFIMEEECEPFKNPEKKLKKMGVDAIIYGDLFYYEETSELGLGVFLLAKEFSEPLEITLKDVALENPDGYGSEIPLQVLLDYFIFEASKTLVYGLNPEGYWLGKGFDENQDNPESLFKAAVAFYDFGYDYEMEEFVEASLLFFEGAMFKADTDIDFQNKIAFEFSSALLTLGRTEKGIKVFEPLKQNQHSATPLFLEIASSQLLDQEKYNQAAELIIELLSFAETRDIDPVNFYILGLILMSSNEEETKLFEAHKAKMKSSTTLSPDDLFQKYLDRRPCNFAAYKDVIEIYLEVSDYEKAEEKIDNVLQNCLLTAVFSEQEFNEATTLALMLWENGYSIRANSLAEFVLSEIPGKSLEDLTVTLIFANYIKGYVRSLQAQDLGSFADARNYYEQALNYYPLDFLDPENPDSFFISLLLSFIELDLMIGGFDQNPTLTQDVFNRLDTLVLTPENEAVKSHFEYLFKILKGEQREIPGNYFRKDLKNPLSLASYWEFQTLSFGLVLKKQEVCSQGTNSSECEKWKLAVRFAEAIQKMGVTPN